MGGLTGRVRGRGMPIATRSQRRFGRIAAAASILLVSCFAADNALIRQLPLISHAAEPDRTQYPESRSSPELRQEPVRTPNREMHPDTSSVFVVTDIPTNSMLVIGSLDQSAAFHTIRLKCEPKSPGAETESLGEVRSDNEFRRISAKSQSVASVEDSRIVTRPSLPLGQDRCFLVPVFDKDTIRNELRAGTAVYSSSRVQVYRCGDSTTSRLLPNDVTDPGLRNRKSSEFAARICAALEDDVLNRVSALLGSISDVDHNGTLTVVLTQLDQQSKPAEFPIRGCVRQSDFLSSDQPGAGDILYLHDTEQIRQDASATDRELVALLAHEVAHATVYSRVLEQLCNAPKGVHLDIDEGLPPWLNEAIAHYVESELVPGSGNLAKRMTDFRFTPHLCPVFAPADVIPFHQRRRGIRAAGTLFLQSFCTRPDSLRLLTEISVPLNERIERIADQSFAGVFRDFCVSQVRAEFCSPDGDSVNGVIAGDGTPCRLQNGGEQPIQLRGTAMTSLRIATPIQRLVVESDSEAQLQVTLITGNQITACPQCRWPSTVD